MTKATQSTEPAPPVDEEVEALRAEQAVEYGTYVANGPIYVNGALAYAKDHAVPVSNVKLHKYLEQGLVREVGAEAPGESAAPVERPQGEDRVLDQNDSAGAAEPTE